MIDGQRMAWCVLVTVGGVAACSSGSAPTAAPGGPDAAIGGPDAASGGADAAGEASSTTLEAGGYPGDGSSNPLGDGASTVCPRGTAYPDGCPDAAPGAAEYPTLLEEYGANRPPWNVAGVEYSVGLPAGTPLSDWQTVTDPNLNVDTSSGVIRCVGTGAVTLDRIDFSLHGGAYIYNPSGGCSSITITNSNFACPTTAPGFTFVQDQNSATYVVKYNNFNGENCWAADGGGGGFAAFLSIGNAVVQYNWFIHSPEQALDTGGNTTIDYRFNLLDDVVISPDAHMNYLQFESGGTASAVVVAFNTSRQTSCGGAEGYQFYNNVTPATIVNPVLSNNTLIAVAPTTSCGTSPNVVMSYMIHGTGPQTGAGITAVSGTGTNNDNYFDPRGAYGAYYPGTMAAADGWASSGNIDMSTGATITPQ